MHTQGMSVDDATKFFQENCYYEEKPARAEAMRGTFDIGYLNYTLGKLQILKLRKDYEVQEGENFSLKKFHDELLNHGMLPIRLLREIMLKDQAKWGEVLIPLAPYSCFFGAHSSFSPRGRGTASKNAPRILADHELGETPLLDDLRELCDRIGGRPTGAPSCERAVDWGVTKFKEAGLDPVRTESFTVPSLWLPETAEASCLTPLVFPIRIAATPYSASTPRHHPLEARLVDAGEGNADDFQKLGETGHGAVALVHSRGNENAG